MTTFNKYRFSIRPYEVGANTKLSIYSVLSVMRARVGLPVKAICGSWNPPLPLPEQLPVYQ